MKKILVLPLVVFLFLILNFLFLIPNFVYAQTPTKTYPLTTNYGDYHITQLIRNIPNPVLSRNISPHWDDFFTAEPFALQVGNQILMWYFGTGFSTGYIPAIGIATSLDGITWQRYAGNPIITTTNLVTPGFNSPHKAWVVKHGDRYYLYYRASTTSGTLLGCTHPDGSPGTGSTSYTGIGVMRSKTGDPFGGWDDLGIKILPEKCSDLFKVDTPSIIYDQEENIWKMWYSTAKGARNEPKYWQYATSPDGITWTKYRDINAKDTLPVDIGIPPDNNWYLKGGLGGMSISKVNGIDHNFFNGFTEYDPSNPQGTGFSNIFYAKSNDGIKWDIADLNPIIRRGEDDGRPSDFDSKHAYRANFFITNTDKCYLYYNGKSSDGGEDIGILASDCKKILSPTPTRTPTPTPTRTPTPTPYPPFQAVLPYYGTTNATYDFDQNGKVNMMDVVRAIIR